MKVKDDGSLVRVLAMKKDSYQIEAYGSDSSKRVPKRDWGDLDVVDRESKWHRNMATDLAALGC